MENKRNISRDKLICLIESKEFKIEELINILTIEMNENGATHVSIESDFDPIIPRQLIKIYKREKFS